MSRPAAVPVDTVRDHITPFVAAGWSHLVIAAAADVSHGTVVSVMRRRRPTVKSGTATQLLRLTTADLLAQRDAAEKTPATGTRRRIEALIWRGWTIAQIATHSGTHQANVDRILHGHRPTITTRTAKAIDTAYRALADTDPPAPDWKAARNITASRRRARRLGYHPAAAWDDIDNPAATPDTGQPSDGRAGLAVEDVEWVLRYERHTWDTLSDRLGVPKDTIYGALRRAGRADLLARLRERSEVA